MRKAATLHLSSREDYLEGMIEFGVLHPFEGVTSASLLVNKCLTTIVASLHLLLVTMHLLLH